MAAHPPQGRDHSLDCYKGRCVDVLIPRVVPCGAEPHIGGRSANRGSPFHQQNTAHQRTRLFS
jgi:hypothetical protein